MTDLTTARRRGTRTSPPGRGDRRAVPTARLAAVGLAAALTAVLAGCSALGQPGSAAVVDGRLVDEAEVHTVTAELRDFLGEEAVAPALVVYLWVIREPVETLAAERGLSISPEQAEDAWLATRERPDGERVTSLDPATAETLAVIEMYDILVQDDQATAQLAERIADLDVDVNPRYGAIDETSEVRPVVPIPPDWLRPSG